GAPGCATEGGSSPSSSCGGNAKKRKSQDRGMGIRRPSRMRGGLLLCFWAGRSLREERVPMAYPVPSHGSPCDVLRRFPMACRGCGRQVVYYECSDGSRVLFDPPDRGKHVCLGPPRPSRIN